MLYVVTSNTFLWYGLESLLYPYESQLISHGSPVDTILGKITTQDLFIIDMEKNPVWQLLDSLKRLEELPEIILIRNDDVPIEYYFGTCLSLKGKDSLNQIRYSILSRKKMLQKDKKGITLSPRESLVLHMSFVGFSVKQISFILGIKSKTVYAHRYQVCRKLGVGRICELLPYKRMIRFKTSETENQNLTAPEPVM